MEICYINIPLAFVTYKPDKVFYSDITRMLEANQAIYIYCNCLESYSIIANSFIPDTIIFKVYKVFGGKIRAVEKKGE